MTLSVTVPCTATLKRTVNKLGHTAEQYILPRQILANVIVQNGMAPRSAPPQTLVILTQFIVNQVLTDGVKVSHLLQQLPEDSLFFSRKEKMKPKGASRKINHVKVVRPHKSYETYSRFCFSLVKS